MKVLSCENLGVWVTGNTMAHNQTYKLESEKFFLFDREFRCGVQLKVGVFLGKHNMWSLERGNLNAHRLAWVVLHDLKIIIAFGQLAITP